MRTEKKLWRNRKARKELARRLQSENPGLEVVHPNAAGIDIAADSDLWVSVGEHASPKPVRSFSPLTCGLRKLCAWLKECKVDTVAMEATGIYWINAYLALRQSGLAVIVVNPRCLKNLQRKTDISDCQWLRYLHSVGLLRASFVPPEHILALRTLSRHRENLTRAGSAHIQRVQKALDGMNLHLHHVIDDITGVTGRAIIEAILGGERDPKRLAGLLNYTLAPYGQGYASEDPEKLPERVIHVINVLARAELQKLPLREAIRASDELGQDGEGRTSGVG